MPSLCLRSSKRESPLRRLGLLFFRSPSSLPVTDMETSGPLKFPSCPFKCVPCSQTPVVSCSLAFTLAGLRPSASSITSAFPPASQRLFPQLYIFRSSISRPALSLPPASDSRCRACPWSSLPARWLSFDRMGFAHHYSDSLTHRTTSANFGGLSYLLPTLRTYLTRRSCC